MLSKSKASRNLIFLIFYFMAGLFWTFNILIDSSKYYYVAYLPIAILGFYWVLSECEKIKKEK